MKKHTYAGRAAALSLSLLLLAGCTAPAAGSPAPGSAPPSPTVAPTPAPTVQPVSAETLTAAIERTFAYDTIYELSQMGNEGNELGFRNAGSTGETMAADRIVEIMKEIGIETVWDDVFEVDAWEFTSATLEVDGRTLPLSSFGGSVGTGDGGLTAELVDLGDGTAPNYEGVDVKGKIALIRFDNNNYWFSAPHYQAELAGAAAVICTIDSASYNTLEDSHFSFDGALRPSIPLLHLPKQDAADLRALLAAGPITATLQADITLTPGGKSRNISGVIPGKDPTQYITLGAHYDGYFHSFQDDLYGVGTILAIAKAILDTGYQPEHTLIFTAFGAEEYGKSDSHYDFCTGVWSHINLIHPELVGNTLAHLEVDSVRPDADTYVLNSTPELHTFFRDYFDGLTPPADPYVNGKLLANANGPWSQDYSMNIAGVPGLCAGKAGSQWKTWGYHTNYDDASAWNETVFDYVTGQYVEMLLRFDRCAISPLDFSNIAGQIADSFAPDLLEDQAAATALTDAVAQLSAKGGEHYALIEAANARFATADSGAADYAQWRMGLEAENQTVLDAFRLVQGDLMKLDIWDMVVYPHEPLQANLTALDETIAALERGDGEAALAALMNVDNTYLAAGFSKEVYEYVGLACMDPARSDLYWGTGKVNVQLDTYDIYHAIFEKIGTSGDWAAELDTLKALRTHELGILTDAVKEETRLLEQVLELLSGTQLSALAAR